MQLAKAIGEDGSQFIGKGRLIGFEARLAHADQRRGNRLMRPALGPQSDARRRRHQNEARILVERIIQRVEPARDEGIIQCPDGKQGLPEQRPRQAGRREHQEKIVFRDTELEMLPRGAGGPQMGAGNAPFAEQVRMTGTRK